MAHINKKSFPSEGEISNMIKEIRQDMEQGPPLYSKKEKRELIILVFYISVGNFTEAKARARLAEFKVITEQAMKNMEEDTNHKIQGFVLPTDHETKVECIFPKNQEELDMSLFNKPTEKNLLP